MTDEYQFYIGYYDNLHSEPSINFQLNRWINYLGESALDDIHTITPKLSDFTSYKEAFLQLAEKAFNEGRILPAAYYFRSAEFFMWEDDPAKTLTRQKFLELLWKQYNISPSNRLSIPYTDGIIHGSLPVYKYLHEKPKDTIVIHGGFDSYIEEFFPLFQYIHAAGYNLVCFEGPGQGGALIDSHLLLTPEWDKPVKAILDFFKLEDVTLIGISMGGCLALRAAAFEPRIKRVVAYDVFYDWMETTLDKMLPIRPVVKTLLTFKAAGLFNRLMAQIMKNSPLFDWATRRAMLVLGVPSPYDVFVKSKFYITRDIAPLIKQDVLLLAGTEDHIIPVNHFYLQQKVLENVHSLTARLFTRSEHAQNHCQIGNLDLAISYIVDWIEFTRHQTN
jgi:pimeloyl-ACP methyl ester carboxylesterase